jgi:hypothetical protein
MVMTDARPDPAPGAGESVTCPFCWTDPLEGEAPCPSLAEALTCPWLARGRPILVVWSAVPWAGTSVVRRNALWR